MDNINFIPANQLPITDAKEVNVLCVADGTVKQKPAKGLGGGGYIMKPKAEEVILGDPVNNEQTLRITANYDELAKVLEAGGSAYVRIPMTTIAPDADEGLSFTYVIAGIHSWGYFPEGVMDEIPVLMACCHLNQIGVGPINFILLFDNGTYVPNLE